MKLMLDAASPLFIALPILLILLVAAAIVIAIYALVRFIIKKNKNQENKK